MSDLRLTFLSALGLVLTVPYLIWRLGRTERYLPLVVVQILMGLLLGPQGLGQMHPGAHALLFGGPVMDLMSGLAWWGVMVFVMLAGIELDLKDFWRHRRDTAITAGFALGIPLLMGGGVGILLLFEPGWQGAKATPWQFVIAVGMACAVTALPILVLFLKQMRILGTPLGQRIIRYASVDDLLLWAVLAALLMDVKRLLAEVLFLGGVLGVGVVLRRGMPRLSAPDRWQISLIWLLACAVGAEASGLHFMVGAFLSGVLLEAEWFGEERLEALREHVLTLLMPVFFLLTGLRTHWQAPFPDVYLVALLLLLASISGKLIGAFMAGRVLRWERGEWSLVGWLLQTKALIMIIFITILEDQGIISTETFAALLFSAVASTVLTVPMIRNHPSLTHVQRICLQR